LEEIRGLNEVVSLKEIIEIYAPLTRLLKIYYDNYRSLNRKRMAYLSTDKVSIPYVIGIAGSVAVGKSTTARILKKLISSWGISPDVYIVTTDGFLFPNSVLQEKNLLDKKGFPESYDLKAMIRFLYRLKSGTSELTVPQYSHLKYDIMQDEELKISKPDIVLFEGLNVLQTHMGRILDDSHDLMVSDFFDFSIYVDAEEKIIKTWFIERFMKLMETAFKNPSSYFKHYASITMEDALEISGDIWDRINGLNLKMNIERTKFHADLILHKVKDHNVDRILLRKI
jgi:pantothenate kinase, bacterial type